MKQTLAVLTLTLAATACGGGDEWEPVAPYVVGTVTTSDVPTTIAAYYDLAALNDLRCGKWLEEDRTLSGLQEMVRDNPDFRWSLARDFNQDGYPCEDELGTGYLPPPETTATEPPATTAAPVETAATTQPPAEPASSQVCDPTIDASWDKEAIRAVQEKIGADPDGVWGPQSRAKQADFCGFENPEEEAGTETTTATTTSAPAEFPLDISPEVNSPAYSRDEWSVSWTGAVDSALRWKRSNCKWAFYSGQSPDCSGNVHRDHLVAVKEAHQSGGHAWGAAKRRQFYLDADNLWVMPAGENSSKSDKDPFEWRPPAGGCRYVQEWVRIKVRHGLSADQREADNIKASGCLTGEETYSGTATAPAPAATTTTTTTIPPTTTATTIVPAASDCVDANTATQAELEAIAGIGPSNAQKIIAARPVSDPRNISGLWRPKNIDFGAFC